MSKLNLNNNFPQIIIPNNKLQMFIDWYNSDLMYEMEIPKAFEFGYLCLDLDGMIKCKMPSIFELTSEGEYELYKHVCNEITSTFSKLTIYYMFEENELKIIIYNALNELVVKDNFNLLVRTIQLTSYNTNSDDEHMNKLQEQFAIRPLEADLKNIVKEIIKYNRNSRTTEVVNDIFDKSLGVLLKHLVFGTLVSSFWYLTTIKSKTKERLLYKSAKKPHTEIEPKRHTNIDTIRNITTPIYNFKYIESTNTERLVTRRKSWKISYAFQVRGHYRHYKTGKVVFIKSYEKGTNNKNSKTTKIQLNPASLI